MSASLFFKSEKNIAHTVNNVHENVFLPFCRICIWMPIWVWRTNLTYILFLPIPSGRAVPPGGSARSREGREMYKGDCEEDELFSWINNYIK